MTGRMSFYSMYINYTTWHKLHTSINITIWLDTIVFTFWRQRIWCSRNNSLYIFNKMYTIQFLLLWRYIQSNLREWETSLRINKIAISQQYLLWWFLQVDHPYFRLCSSYTQILFIFLLHNKKHSIVFYATNGYIFVKNAYQLRRIQSVANYWLGAQGLLPLIQIPP